MRSTRFDDPPWWKSWTLTKVISLFIYAIFFLASVWATMKSIEGTFEFPLFITSVLSVGIILSASLFLKLLNNTIEDRNMAEKSKNRRKGLFFFLWLLLWMISLMSNVHSFYLVGALDDIQKRELNDVSTKLNLLRENTATIFDQATEAFKREVNSEIFNLKSQIMNKGNRGLGPKAERIINLLEQILDTKITRLKAKGRSAKAQIQLANDMAFTIENVRDAKLKEIQEQKQRILTLLDKEQLNKIIEELQDCIINYTTKETEEINALLSKSYVVYNKCNQFVQNELKTQIGNRQCKLELDVLPAEVESIQLRHVSNGLANIRRGTKYDSSRIIWALFFALVVDLACFAIIYFGILDQKNN